MGWVVAAAFVVLSEAYERPLISDVKHRIDVDTASLRSE